ncbi:MAG: TIGR00730 family Rossman fold protein [Chitinophagaceae bacterium]|nr:TIGR00730 family Rossman fold protein [Chitinophagaceae bacterium]
MKATSMVVFCGSKSGNNPLYETDAKLLGNLLAENNVRLIYGGGNRGMMGAVANGVLEKGGTVTGIIPEILNQFEHQHDEITELIVVENMHVRKRLLYEKSDAAIILPGGFGTMDELFEIVTWNQLSIHDKPIYILNTAGFYDALLSHISHMLKEGFLYTSLEDAVTVISSPTALFK